MAAGASGSGSGASSDRHVALLLNETSIQANREFEENFIKLLKEYCKINTVIDKEVMELAPAIIGEKMNLPADEVLCRIVQLRGKFVNFRKFLKKYVVSYNSKKNTVTLGEKYDKGFRNSKLETPSMKFFRDFGLSFYRKLQFIFFIARAALIDEEPHGYHAEDIKDRDSNRNYMPELYSDDEEEEEEEEEEESDDEFAMAVWRRF